MSASVTTDGGSVALAGGPSSGPRTGAVESKSRRSRSTSEKVALVACLTAICVLASSVRSLIRASPVLILLSCNGQLPGGGAPSVLWILASSQDAPPRQGRPREAERTVAARFALRCAMLTFDTRSSILTGVRDKRAGPSVLCDQV